MSVVTVYHGDSREVLTGLADSSIDSVVTDPPYALVSIGKRFGKDGAAPAKAGKTGAYARASSGFMGQRWDTGETAFDPEFWSEVLRVLKPGGHVIAASGTRTYHRLACAVEDAGFEIRDTIMWCYATGFPKSHDIAKGIDKSELKITRGRAGRQGDSFGKEYERTAKGAAISDNAKRWEGWGSALKPALEPWVLARKPMIGTLVANVLTHGTGALNIDGCRIGYDPEDTNPATNPLHRKQAGYANGNAPDSQSTSYSLKDGTGERNPNNGGRWPANLVHDGSAEVSDAFPSTGPGGGYPAQGAKFGLSGGDRKQRGEALQLETEGGSAARFFYSAKADAEDRLGSKHPTVKPVDLMAWLCRLVTPPGGLVLDPFAGSGSTGVACIGEGFDCILIEREAAYVADIERRVAWAKGEGRLTTQEMARDMCPLAAAGNDLPLFADADTSQPASQPASADAGSTESSRTNYRADGIEVVTA